MRVLQGLAYALVLALAVSSLGVSASTPLEEMTLSKLEGKETNPVESSRLRRHLPAADEEERGWGWLLNVLKLDDLPPQKAIEMTNLQKFDDIIDTKTLDNVVDLKKLDPNKADDKMHDDLNFLVNYILPDLKKKKVTMKQILNEIAEAHAKERKTLGGAIGLKKVDTTKADDELTEVYNNLKYMVDNIIPDYKKRNVPEVQIRNELVNAGVTDSKMIENVLAWVRESRGV